MKRERNTKTRIKKETDEHIQNFNDEERVKQKET